MNHLFDNLNQYQLMTYVAKLFPFSNPDALKQTFRGIYMKHENHPILLSPGQCCIYNTGSVTGAGRTLDISIFHHQQITLRIR